MTDFNVIYMDNMFGNVMHLRETQYFYKGILKLKNKQNVNSLNYSDYEEHPELPRIPYLNPFYKNISINIKSKNPSKRIRFQIPAILEHSSKIDFEYLNKYLYSPMTYLYRYKRYTEGVYDYRDEDSDLLNIGYNRSSKFIPNLQQSLILQPSVYYKDNIIKIYLSCVSRVLYRNDSSNLISYFSFLRQGGKLYEGLFCDKTNVIYKISPCELGPNKVHGSDGTGNFYNMDSQPIFYIFDTNDFRDLIND